MTVPISDNGQRKVSYWVEFKQQGDLRLAVSITTLLVGAGMGGGI